MEIKFFAHCAVIKAHSKRHVSAPQGYKARFIGAKRIDEYFICVYLFVFIGYFFWHGTC